MREEEKNRDSLRRAIRQMQTYDPPSNRWNAIEKKLEEGVGADDTVLQEAVEVLPTHAPPAEVWNQLARQLDAKKHRQVRMKRMRFALSIAASLALVLTAAWWTLREAPPKISKHYSQETVQQFQLEVDWDSEEDLFNNLQEQLASVNIPSVNNLKLELEELTSAKQEVEQMLQSYGQDPQLVKQLGEIERVRSDIYRQIIELI